MSQKLQKNSANTFSHFSFLSSVYLYFHQIINVSNLTFVPGKTHCNRQHITKKSNKKNYFHIHDSFTCLFLHIRTTLAVLEFIQKKVARVRNQFSTLHFILYKMLWKRNKKKIVVCMRIICFMSCIHQHNVTNTLTRSRTLTLENILYS